MRPCAVHFYVKSVLARSELASVSSSFVSLVSFARIPSFSAEFNPSLTNSTNAWLIKLDFPEPETPVTHVITPSGISISTWLTLF